MSPLGADEGIPAAEPTIVSLGEFAAVEEPGAAALLGDETGALIPEGGDVLLYGDGGAGKTTLTIDLAFHLAAGSDWLGIRVARPLRVLMIENEGPRPLLRQKLRRKIDGWSGPAADGRASIVEFPWAQFSFAEKGRRDWLAEQVRELGIDVVIAGPLTRLGMDAAGTLQEVVAFQRLVDDVRRCCGRPLTMLLVHHENKAGAVSGAWEGAGDTLLHMQAAGNGHAVLFVQKARWAAEWHQRTLKLAWAPGESFQLEDDERDYVTVIRQLLSDGEWRRLKEIACPVEDGGCGVAETTAQETLEGHPELFEMRTGDAAKVLGRDPRSKLWGLRSAQKADNADSAFRGGAGELSASAFPLKGRRQSEPPQTKGDGSALDAQRRPNIDPDSCRRLERLQAYDDIGCRVLAEQLGGATAAVPDLDVEQLLAAFPVESGARA